jgi:TonB family protein
MPKGEQLKTMTPKTKSQPQSKPQEPTKQQPPAPKTPPIPVPEPKKAFERHIAPTVATIDRKPQPKKEFNLYDSLSQADDSAKTSTTISIKSSDSVQKLYGDKFGELSAGEQKYILDNSEAMRRITQGVLNRYGRSRIPDNLRVNDINMVEFYLHPDGSMSDMKMIKNSQFSILDDTTRETIEIAYKDYPRPQQKTYIRYRVWYSLNQ